MSDNISKDILELLATVSKERYEIVSDDKFLSFITHLKPEEINLLFPIRIKRSNTPNNSYKTLLFVNVSVISNYETVMSWIVAVRDELLNNESTDLYLFLLPTNEDDFSLETCINIEASEDYCRKYVRRPTENLSDLFNRTFLCEFESGEQIGEVFEPLRLALQATGKDHPWFNEQKQQLWERAFLSGSSGHEIVEILFNSDTL